MPKPLRLFLLSIPFLFITTCTSRDIPLPPSLGSLHLEQVKSDEEARLEINRLHGKPITFQRGYVGTYVADNGSAKLWVSEHSSTGDAAAALAKMARGMKLAKSGEFWHLQEISIEGLQVYFVLGMGQAHYFFAKGNRVYWLAADPLLAKQTIRDLVSKVIS